MKEGRYPNSGIETAQVNLSQLYIPLKNNIESCVSHKSVGYKRTGQKVFAVAVYLT